MKQCPKYLRHTFLKTFKIWNILNIPYNIPNKSWIANKVKKKHVFSFNELFTVSTIYVCHCFQLIQCSKQ